MPPVASSADLYDRQSALNRTGLHYAVRHRATAAAVLHFADTEADTNSQNR